MRIVLSTLFLLAAAAHGQDYADEASGIKIALAEGWNRDAAAEVNGVVFQALHRPEKGGLIQFNVWVAPADQFPGEQAWLDSEKKGRAGGYSKITEPFQRVTQILGERSALGYAIAGEGKTSDGKVNRTRYKVLVVMNGANAFLMTEISYNDAHKIAGAESDAMWEGVKFGNPKVPAIDLSVAADVPAQEVKDAAGNFALQTIAGWRVDQQPPREGAPERRLTLVRVNAKGLVVARLDVFRFEVRNPPLFQTGSPLDFMTTLKQRGFFSPSYGHKDYEVVVDESNLMGAADKSASFLTTGWNRSQQEAIQEAEAKQSKGLKVKIPDPPKIERRGRLAFLSPHVYLCRARAARDEHSGDAGYQAEVDQLIEGFRFLSATAKLPPASFARRRIGNTMDDPGNARKRKGPRVRVEAFNAKRPESKKPSAVLEIDFAIPKGFRQVTEGLGGDLKLVLGAQDKDNNSVIITVAAKHTTQLPPRNDGSQAFGDPKNVFQGWRENWESVAQSSGKINEKPPRVKIGGKNAKGYEFTGKRDGFAAARRDYMVQTLGWRILIQIDVRGDGLKVFDKSIKSFIRGLKLKKGLK